MSTSSCSNTKKGSKTSDERKIPLFHHKRSVRTYVHWVLLQSVTMRRSLVDVTLLQPAREIMQEVRRLTIINDTSLSFLKDYI